MKKMNYEAPKAEMIEMQMPVVMAATNLGGGQSSGGQGSGPGGIFS